MARGLVTRGELQTRRLETARRLLRVRRNPRAGMLCARSPRPRPLVARARTLREDTVHVARAYIYTCSLSLSLARADALRHASSLSARASIFLSLSLLYTHTYTRTHDQTLSFALSLPFSLSSSSYTAGFIAMFPYREYLSRTSPCRAMEADRWHSSLSARAAAMLTVRRTFDRAIRQL